MPKPIREDARLRRAVGVTLASLGTVFGALALLFGVVLEPGKELDGCSTGLYPGTYADAIAPAHLTAFAAVALLAAWLSAQRSPTGRPPRRTLGVLALLSVFALAATIRHELMDLPAFIALIVFFPLGALAVTATLINAVIVLVSRRPPDRGWARHAALAQAVAWLAIVVGIPAALAAVWTNGAGLFCF